MHTRKEALPKHLDSLLTRRGKQKHLVHIPILRDGIQYHLERTLTQRELVQQRLGALVMQKETRRLQQTMEPMHLDTIQSQINNT